MHVGFITSPIILSLLSTFAQASTQQSKGEGGSNCHGDCEVRYGPLSKHFHPTNRLRSKRSKLGTRCPSYLGMLVLCSCIAGSVFSVFS